MSFYTLTNPHEDGPNKFSHLCTRPQILLPLMKTDRVHLCKPNSGNLHYWQWMLFTEGSNQRAAGQYSQRNITSSPPPKKRHDKQIRNLLGSHAKLRCSKEFGWLITWLITSHPSSQHHQVLPHHYRHQDCISQHPCLPLLQLF